MHTITIHDMYSIEIFREQAALNCSRFLNFYENTQSKNCYKRYIELKLIKFDTKYPIAVEWVYRMMMKEQQILK